MIKMRPVVKRQNSYTHKSPVLTIFQLHYKDKYNPLGLFWLLLASHQWQERTPWLHYYAITCDTVGYEKPKKPCGDQRLETYPPNQCHATKPPGFKEEIIKVREWIPHIGPLTRVIHLNLFLDMVPSSSANFTRALRGQPGRLYSQGHAKLPETKWRQMWKKVL